MSGDAVIVGTTSASTLTNVDNIISGAGQIGSGDGNLTLVNAAHGTIEADISGTTLTLDTGHAIANAGILEAANGGTLQIDDAVSGGSAIVAGGTLIFDAPSDVDVTFDNGTAYGELALGHLADFSGQISGFAGTAPDLAHSDAIDLADIAFGSNITFAYDDNAGTDTGGTLTIFDGGNAVGHLAFATGEFTTASFNLSADGSGGTLITDPPVPTPSTAAATTSPDDHANTIVGASSGNTLTGTDGHDNFVFNAITDMRAGAGNFDTITNFTPTTADHDTARFLGHRRPNQCPGADSPTARRSRPTASPGSKTARRPTFMPI